jgi:hypothetical protein
MTAENRTTAAMLTMDIGRVAIVVFGVLFSLADLALCVYLIVTGHWGWLALNLIVGVPAFMTIGGWIAGGIGMAFYGVAKCFDADEARSTLENA